MISLVILAVVTLAFFPLYDIRYSFLIKLFLTYKDTVTQGNKRLGRTSQLIMIPGKRKIGKVRHLQTVEELNETGVETTYQLISSSLAHDTNSD